MAAWDVHTADDPSDGAIFIWIALIVLRFSAKPVFMMEPLKTTGVMITTGMMSNAGGSMEEVVTVARDISGIKTFYHEVLQGVS